MTKTPTIPSTMWPSLQRRLAEMQRYAYLYGNKSKASQLTGPPKTPSDLYEAAIGAIHSVLEEQMRSEQEATRYREFVERFVLARAAGLGNLKDGFNAVCDAKAIYKMIADSAHDYRPEPQDMAQVGQATNYPIPQAVPNYPIPNYPQKQLPDAAQASLARKSWGFK